MLWKNLISQPNGPVCTLTVQVDAVAATFVLFTWLLLLTGMVSV